MQALHTFLNSTPFDTVMQKMKEDLQVAVKKGDNNCYLFNYEDDAPRGHPIVDGCRGTIWKVNQDKTEWVCVRSAMDRFFNLGEIVDNVDTNLKQDEPFSLQEKLDGTLVLLYWNNDKQEWILGTRNTFDCTDINVRGNQNMKQVFDSVFFTGAGASPAITSAPAAPAVAAKIDLPDSYKKYTFLFELCSPYNQVVVYHPLTNVTLLSVRENSFPYLESDIMSFKSFKSFKKATQFSFKSIDEAKDYIETRFKNGNSFEGMIVVQGLIENPRRLKLKSKGFVTLAHSPGGNLKAIPEEQIVKALLKGKNELAELLTYYPEWSNLSQQIEKRYDSFCQKVANCQKDLKTDDNLDKDSRAKLAKLAKESVYPPYFFALMSKKATNLNEYLLNIKDFSIVVKLFT